VMVPRARLLLLVAVVVLTLTAALVAAGMFLTRPSPLGGGGWINVSSATSGVRPESHRREPTGVTTAAVPHANTSEISPLVTPSASPESLESRIKRDFVNDQDALIRYYGGEILAASGAASGQAELKAIGIQAVNQAHQQIEVVTIRPDQITVGTGTDPHFPPDAIVLEERGYETQVLKARSTGAVVSTKTLQIDDHFLMKVDSYGQYRIDDWDLSEQPVAGTPAPPPTPTPDPSPSPSASPTPAASPMVMAIIGRYITDLSWDVDLAAGTPYFDAPPTALDNN